MIRRSRWHAAKAFLFQVNLTVGKELTERVGSKVNSRRARCLTGGKAVADWWAATRREDCYGHGTLRPPS